jgi:hypothetical protein
LSLYRLVPQSLLPVHATLIIWGLTKNQDIPALQESMPDLDIEISIAAVL